MSVIDFNTLDQTQEPVEVKQPTVDPVQEPIQSQGDQKMIVVDGPLSTIYTQALQAVYHRNSQEETVAQESAAMDTAQNEELIKIIEAKKQEKQQLDELNEKQIYLYATSAKDIEDDLTRNFDDVNKAITNESYKAVYVCIENHTKRISAKHAMFENYLYENNVRVVHSKNAAIQTLQKV